jgi:hypothetical protein
MENTEPHFIKSDDNKIINVNCIRWVKKIDECLHVCNKQTGCSIHLTDVHKICKLNNPNSYERLNKYFE